MVQSSESSLASIAQSLRGIASVMKTLNENLVEFAKQAREKPEVIQMPAAALSTEYYQDLTKRVEGYAAGMPVTPNDYREQHDIQKEGE
jgi:hypothetical protein